MHNAKIELNQELAETIMLQAQFICKFQNAENDLIFTIAHILAAAETLGNKHGIKNIRNFAIAVEDVAD